MILDKKSSWKTISSDDYNMPETDLHVAFGDSWKQSNDAYFSNIREGGGFSIWN